MNEIKLIQELSLYNGVPVNNKKESLKEYNNAADYCQFISNYGADAIYITEISETDEEHDKNIDAIKEIVSTIDVPVIVGGNIKRLEDVKKYLYAGAEKAVLDLSKTSNADMIKEASDRFGKDKIAVITRSAFTIEDSINVKEEGASLILKSLVSSEDSEYVLPVLYINNGTDSDSVIDYNNKELSTAMAAAIKLSFHNNVYGYCYKTEVEGSINFMELKNILLSQNIPVKTYESKIQFNQLTTNENGLIPVIVQDYKTNEVLMLAYMNEEAFDHTIKTGRMTYYSRSRNELWEKGLTSGHYQYFKELLSDCDNDTLLAKVFQVGVACHTGKYSCFFNEIIKKEYVERNPHKIFEEVFSVIKDRKINPKQGSYTNYLFDKGIDKILKKVGEEACEILIAAKNPNPEEIKYEISDFLYHVMVLMAEKNVTWEDITTELARR